MKLSATRMAQFVVQGDYFSVQANESHLILNAKHLIETVPFSAWDGKCHIIRGLLWGTLRITVFPDNQDSRILCVYGLPWKALKPFAQNLTQQYQTWLLDQKNTFTQVAPLLIALVDEIDHGDGFLRQTDLLNWQQKVDSIFKQNKAYYHILAAVTPPWSSLLHRWLNQGEASRAYRNQQWQTRELERCSFWFDNIESSPLNLSQRKSVLMDENYNLLLAGAGSGKTSVLIAKAQYLISHQDISPTRILMLAFGKKAKQEMSHRLAQANIKDIKVATFHGFASTLIKNITGFAPVLSCLATDEESKMHWLKLSITENLAQVGVEKRWLKHLSQWAIPGLSVGSEQALVVQLNDPRFQRWFWRLLDLILQQNLSLAMIKEITQHGAHQQESELALIWPLIRAYQKELAGKKEVDFNGLIREATKSLSRKNASLAAQFEYILVDEYQDISPSRLALLEALCKAKSERAPSLFAVGDDWQAIYRFAGADVSLTTDFQNRFPDGSIEYLETTYRFNSKIGEVANRFIQVNPKQLNKPLRSLVERNKKAVHVIDSEGVEQEIQKLSDRVGEKESSLLFIGRNNANKPITLGKWQQRWPNLKMQYVTAHSSKGLEADYTFIVDVNEGVFPAKNRQQGLEHLLLATEDEMEYAEERRLFYVALTRARHECWICTHSNKVSPFITELCQYGYCVNVKLAKKTMKPT